MNIEDSISTINRKFKYRNDFKWFDTWRILENNQTIWEGDCEDYSLTVIWLYSDKNAMKFIWNIVSFRFLIWYAVLGNGEGHAVTRYGDMYFDNIQRKLVSLDKLKADGYRFVFPYVFPLLFLKLGVSKIGKPIISILTRINTK